ncbi:hypothetical protein OG535_40585 [Kitasatospora sp. NBC_00085]|uniref:hypothetical protein n=1 Tax=unclassified Kitasatospora TaxID=2633591 RepID=UPI002F91AEEC
MSNGFRDGVSAAVASGSHGESGFWFFKGNQALKTDPDGNKVEYGPADITASEAWPALAPFGRDIDAAVFSGTGFWFFKGNQCTKTSPDGRRAEVPDSPITAEGNWPALAGTEFENGVDAAVESGDGGKSGFWFFKGNQALKTDPDGNKVEYGPADITAPEAWPALAPFGRDIDAAVFSGTGFWFFKGNQCTKTTPDGNHVLVPASAIVAEGNWPALDR